MWAQGNQGTVLGAQRLTFRGVDHYHCMAVRAVGDSSPFAPRGKPRAASTAQSALLQHLDQPSASRRISPEAMHVLVDALVTRGLVRPCHEPPANSRSSARLDL